MNWLENNFPVFLREFGHAKFSQSLSKFTLRSSSSIINNANASITGALLSGIKDLHSPNTR